MDATLRRALEKKLWHFLVIISFDPQFVGFKLVSARAARSRSERMADQRSRPSVLITACCAARHAGLAFSKSFLPFAEMDTLTRPPRPAPAMSTKPSRSNGRRL